MHIHIYILIYIYIHKHMYININIYIYIYVQKCKHRYMIRTCNIESICISMHIHSHTYVHECKYLYIFIYMNVCMREKSNHWLVYVYTINKHMYCIRTLVCLRSLTTRAILRLSFTRRGSVYTCIYIHIHTSIYTCTRK
jgi:hypothetical protein